MMRDLLVALVSVALTCAAVWLYARSQRDAAPPAMARFACWTAAGPMVVDGYGHHVEQNPLYPEVSELVWRSDEGGALNTAALAKPFRCEPLG